MNAIAGKSVTGGLPVLVAVAALALGAWIGVSQFNEAPSAPQSLSSGTRLPTPKPLTPFQLTAHDGKPFDLQRLTGDWTFLAIGYTHCPDICPTTLGTFDAIRHQLKAGEADFVFVSVDPERDSPAKLAEYVPYFNAEFLGATGSHSELRKLTGQLGLLYRHTEAPNSAMGYVVDHSAAIMLIDPLGRLSAIFSAPHDPAAMTRDYTLLKEETL